MTAYYREQLVENGFDIIPGTHPCVPIMLYDEKLAVQYAKKMMEKGVYVVAFSYLCFFGGNTDSRYVGNSFSLGYSVCYMWFYIDTLWCA